MNVLTSELIGNYYRVVTDKGTVLVSKADKVGHVRVEHQLGDFLQKAEHLLHVPGIAAIAKNLCSQYCEIFISPKQTVVHNNRTNKNYSKNKSKGK
jgi:hypothetical protein